MSNIILWNSREFKYAPVRPAGPHYLAFWLRQYGYTVKVIDFCNLLSTQDLVAITEKHITSDTKAIGVSTTFWKDESWSPDEPLWVSSARSIIENRKPTLYWLLGGASSHNPKLNYEWIKFHGYAEDTILKWMDENSNKLRLRPIFDIKSCKGAEFTHDDFIQSHEVIPIELGRGCQFKCRFCAYPLIGKKKGTYIRNSDLIREEFIRNYNEYGTTRYCFLDDTVNESEEKIQGLADIVQSLPFKLEWTGYNRLDLIWSRQNTIQLLKDSGLRTTFFGIESFHPKASMDVGKGWNGKLAKPFLLELREKWNNITWTLGFIAGLTGETTEDLDNTVSWCIDNKMYCWKFTGLSINRTSSKAYSSEFETEYEKYGYSFEGEKNMSKWKNDLWTFDSAQSYASLLDRRSRKFITPGAFTVSELINDGYSYDQLMYKKNIDLSWGIFEEKTKVFLEKYVKFQLS